MESECTYLNKTDVVDAAVHDDYLSACWVLLNASTANKMVNTPQMFFLTRCLMPEFLAGARLPHEAWEALRKRAKTLWILDAFAPI